MLNQLRNKDSKSQTFETVKNQTSQFEESPFSLSRDTLTVNNEKIEELLRKVDGFHKEFHEHKRNNDFKFQGFSSGPNISFPVFENISIQNNVNIHSKHLNLTFYLQRNKDIMVDLDLNKITDPAVQDIHKQLENNISWDGEIFLKKKNNLEEHGRYFLIESIESQNVRLEYYNQPDSSILLLH